MRRIIILLMFLLSITWCYAGTIKIEKLVWHRFNEKVNPNTFDLKITDAPANAAITIERGNGAGGGKVVSPKGATTDKDGVYSQDAIGGTGGYLKITIGNDTWVGLVRGDPRIN